MSNKRYLFYDKLLEDLGVINPNKYSHLIIQNNFRFYDNYYNNAKNSKIQTGGSIYKDYEYDNCSFRVYENQEDNRYTYSIHNNNDEGNRECVIIFIPTEEKISFAHIENISSYSNCFRCASVKSKTGTMLLIFLLSFIKNKLKKKHNLSYISLQDNSLYYCKKTQINIKFSSFYMLTRGDTWYGKYGFVPFDFDNQSIDKNRYKAYKKNSETVNNTKVHQTNIYKLIYKAINKLNISDRFPEKILYDIIEKNKEKSVKDFLYNFTKNMDFSCDVFGLIYEDLMDKLHMTEMQGWSYYLSL